MAVKKDYYKILGIDKNATDIEIKKAFRDAVKKYHPDVNKESDALAKFKESREAYVVLSDPIKRNQYDQFGYSRIKINETALSDIVEEIIKEIFSNFSDDSFEGLLMNVLSFLEYSKSSSSKPNEELKPKKLIKNESN